MLAINAITIRLLLAILNIAVGMWALRQGWIILRHGKVVLPHPARVALWILRHTKGEEAASKRYDEITEPSRMRLSGFEWLLAGILLLIAGNYMLVTVIL